MHFISYLLWSVRSFSVAELVYAFILLKKNKKTPEVFFPISLMDLFRFSKPNDGLFHLSLDIMLSIKATKCKLFLNYLTVSCPISLKIHKSGCN